MQNPSIQVQSIPFNRNHCAYPMGHVSDKTSGILSIVIVSALFVRCKLQVPIEAAAWWALVATRFIYKYVKNKHTMEKACKKLSTYIHTTCIRQTLTTKNACWSTTSDQFFSKKLGTLSVHPYLPVVNFWWWSCHYKNAHFLCAPL